MKLCKLRIHNYRSIHDLELEVPEIFILLGPNNHGKSNIMRALEFGLSTSAKPEQDDFFHFHREDDCELWVEMTFNNLTPQERTTFRKYIRSDDKLRIRKTAHLNENRVIEIAYNGYIQEPEEWWLKSSAWERLSSRERVANEAESVPELENLLNQGGRITKQTVDEFQQRYIEQNYELLTLNEVMEEGPLLGQRNVAGGILPEFILVPAVRDLTDEVKVKTTTTFGRLLQRAVREMAERDPRFVELRNGLHSLISDLNARPDDSSQASELARLEELLTSELASWGVRASIEVMPPEVEKIFELGTQLHLDDGVKTIAEKKGHGLQRAVIFALVRAWARVLRREEVTEGTRPRRASESIFFAIEEPELYLHPHAQRQLFRALKNIAASPQHQVFLSTHSTHFVDIEQYQSIAMVSRWSLQEGTQVRQCTRELFQGDDAAIRRRRFHMAYWINPDRSELFFARRVVLTEGETEKTILPFLAEKLDCFDPEVTVIDCGSKHNLPLYIEILNAFRIPYLVVHDEDPLPDPIPSDWTEDKHRGKQRTYKLNNEIRELVNYDIGEIEMLSPDFERLAGVSRTQGEKKGKALAALDHFADRAPEDIPVRLVEVVKKAYASRPASEARN